MMTSAYAPALFSSEALPQPMFRSTSAILLFSTLVLLRYQFDESRLCSTNWARDQA